MRKILIAALGMLLGSTGAWAAGTLAGTFVDNNATLTYNIAGGARLTVDANLGASGSADRFVVDKKIDLVLATTDTDQQPAELNQDDVETNFQFKNEGNADQNFTFSVKNLTTGDANNGEADYDADVDSAQVSDLLISCDGRATWAATVTIPVDHDDNKTCIVRAKMPTGVADGSIMNIELEAKAVKADGSDETNTTTADSQIGTPDVVLADGHAHGTLGENGGGKGDASEDGKDVARSGYIIKTADLHVDKTSCVLSDPVHGVSNDAKRIPGAVIRYAIDINNTGSGDANSLTLSDQLSDKIAWWDAGIHEIHYAACDCKNPIGSPDVHDTVNHNGATPDVVSAALNSDVVAGGHACVYFDVEIQ